MLQICMGLLLVRRNAFNRFHILIANYTGKLCGKEDKTRTWEELFIEMSFCFAVKAPGKMRKDGNSRI